jgi:hypothetical protein
MRLVKIYLIRLMYPLFLFKIVCYTCRPFTITLASSAYISADFCLSGSDSDQHRYILMMVKALHVKQSVLTRNEGDISLIRYI